MESRAALCNAGLPNQLSKNKVKVSFRQRRRCQVWGSSEMDLLGFEGWLMVVRMELPEMPCRTTAPIESLGLELP
jgi:hypothetical protein